MKKSICIFISSALFLAAGFVRGQDPQLSAGNIKEVVAAMTVEEKAKLVVGTGMRFGGGAVVGEVTNILFPQITGEDQLSPSSSAVHLICSLSPQVSGRIFPVTARFCSGPLYWGQLVVQELTIKAAITKTTKEISAIPPFLIICKKLKVKG